MAIQYHNRYSCNKCSKLNKVSVACYDGGYVSECNTTCTVCGFEDYWVQGFFESSQNIESNCKRYSFGETS